MKIELTTKHWIILKYYVYVNASVYINVLNVNEDQEYMLILERYACSINHSCLLSYRFHEDLSFLMIFSFSPNIKLFMTF